MILVRNGSVLWNVACDAQEAITIMVSRHWFCVDCVSLCGVCTGVLPKSDSASSKIWLYHKRNKIRELLMRVSIMKSKRKSGANSHDFHH